MREIRGVLKVTNFPTGEAWWTFYCPGCEDGHTITNVWEFDGNFEAPTFSPSVLSYSRQTLINEDLEGDALTAPENVRTIPNCHSFIRAGVIEYLSDSGHALAGQSVPMMPFKPRHRHGAH